MSVEGRELHSLDVSYLMAGINTTGFCFFKSAAVCQKSDEALKRAYRQVIKVTPILQTRVVERCIDEQAEATTGKTPSFVFSKFDSEDEWPQLEIHRGDYNQSQIDALTRELHWKDKATLAFDNGDMDLIKRTPIRVIAVLGSEYGGLSFWGPHYVNDGIGFAAVTAKILMYFMTPRLLWYAADQLSPTAVPTLTEVAFKKDLKSILPTHHRKVSTSSSSSSSMMFPQPRDWISIAVYASKILSYFTRSFSGFPLAPKLKMEASPTTIDQNNMSGTSPPRDFSKPDMSLSKYDPENFSFNGLKHKHEMTGGSFVLAIPSADRMDECRKQLREAGITMSAAVTALTVKTLAVLLDKHDYNPHAKPLMAKTLIDLRPIGSWGDSRDFWQKYQLPTSANLCVGLHTQIPYKLALSSDDEGKSLVEISSMIKDDIEHVRKDVEYRAKVVGSSVGHGTCGLLCGASSMILPKYAIDSLRMEGIVSHRQTPRCFFTLITRADRSEISLNILLPVPGLNDIKEVSNAVRLAAAGSPLAHLLDSEV
jgi:hypothetical protein